MYDVIGIYKPANNGGSSPCREKVQNYSWSTVPNIVVYKSNYMSYHMIVKQATETVESDNAQSYTVSSSTL